MSRIVQLGPYSLSTDSRGIRVERAVDGAADGLRARITLSAMAQGHPPAAVSIQRFMEAGGEGRIDLHGFTTDALSVDGQVSHDRATDGLRFTLQFVNAGAESAMRFGVHLELMGEAEPQWFVPGLFYNENRLVDCPVLYPRYSAIHRDPEKFVSNHWSFRSDRAALPAVFCETLAAVGFVAAGEFAAMGGERARPVGPTSIGFSTEDGFPVLSAEVPYAEQPVSFSFSRMGGPLAEERFVAMEPSRVLTMTAQVGLLARRDGALQGVYRALYREFWEAQPPRPKVGSLNALRLAVEGLTEWHLDEGNRVICDRVPFAGAAGRVPEGSAVPGGAGGALAAYALLWHGRGTADPWLVQAATGVLDRIASSLAACGTVRPPEPDGGTEPGRTAGVLHARATAETVLFLMRALRLELESETAHRDWHAAIASTLDFAVRAQETSGALPECWDSETGEVRNRGGSAGLCWVAPLAAASHRDASGRYLEAALRAGDYYAQFVESGFPHGSEETLPLVPTSDDCHFAAIAYLLLYEADRGERWLQLAGRAAEQAFTYRMAWDTTFAAGSVLAQAEFRTRGGDVFSPAVPLLTAGGLVSYGEMQKLSALTEDDYFGARAREGRTFASQLLARVDGEFNARRGQAPAAIHHADWWQARGMFTAESCGRTLGLTAYAELLEMHLVIPFGALTGDEAGVVEAASRSSIVQMQRDLLLPGTVEARRRQGEEQRQSRITPEARGAEPVELAGGPAPVQGARRGSSGAVRKISSGSTPKLPGALPFVPAVGAEAEAASPGRQRRSSSAEHDPSGLPRFSLVRPRSTPPPPAPPDWPRGGLLANLHEEDARPKFTPLASAQAEPERPPEPDEAVDAPAPDAAGEEPRAESGEAKIKWKIF